MVLRVLPSFPKKLAQFPWPLYLDSDPVMHQSQDIIIAIVHPHFRACLPIVQPMHLGNAYAGPTPS